MPELPEVETIARMLAPVLTGRRIAAAAVLDPGVAPDGEAVLAGLTAGRSISGVTRRGKLCLIELDGGGHLAVHLKMTGRLWIAGTVTPPPKYARLTLALDDGRHLVFSDMRRFGTVRAFSPGAIADWKFFGTLGPEPFAMAPDDFAARMGRTSRAIKAALLDQTVVAGVGNIYADESLFRAGIRPMARADRIARPRLNALLAAVVSVMEEAIAAGGSTIRDYRTPEGVEGAFQHDFKVYGRAGQACGVCGKMIKAVKIAGRTSSYCPACQK